MKKEMKLLVDSEGLMVSASAVVLVLCLSLGCTLQTAIQIVIATVAVIVVVAFFSTLSCPAGKGGEIAGSAVCTGITVAVVSGYNFGTAGTGAKVMAIGISLAAVAFFGFFYSFGFKLKFRWVFLSLLAEGLIYHIIIKFGQLGLLKW